MKDKIKDLLHSDGFRTRAKEFYRNYSVHVSQKKIGELITAEQVKQAIDMADLKEMNFDFFAEHNRAVADIVEKYIADNNVKISDAIGPDSEAKIKDLLMEPIELPHETVRKFVAQDAIQQLFVTIITDSIVGFNKKINPLSGLTSALGMETQIKNFLTPFMGQVLDSAADFINSDGNRELFTKMAVSVFDIVKNENPKPYIEAISDTQKQKVDAMLRELAGDEKLSDLQKKIAHHVVDEYHDVIKEKTVRDLFEISPEDFADKWSDLSLDLLLPLMQEDIVLDFLLNEVKELLD